MTTNQAMRLAGIIGLCFIGGMACQFWRPTSAKVKLDASGDTSAFTFAKPGVQTGNDRHSAGIDSEAQLQQDHTDALLRNLATLLITVQAEMNQLDDGRVGEKQMQELQAYAESLSATDLPVVVKELQKLQTTSPTAAGRNLQLRLLNRWTENNAAEALNWASQTLRGDIRQEALAHMADIWAKQDLAAAIAWAGQLPSNDEQKGILEQVAYEAAYINPIQALNLAVSLPENSGRNPLIIQAASQWAATAPEDAVAWANRISDQALREQVIQAIAVTWGDNNPFAAAQLVVSSLSPGPSQNVAVIGIVQRWASADQAAAQNWVAQFPDGDLRQAAQIAINEIIARRQPPAVAQ